MNLEPQWVVGFVDGEGCWSIEIIKNPTMKVGYQVQLCLTVVQHERDIQVLHGLKDFFKCGSVKINRKDHISTRYMWRTRNLTDFNNAIIPFFEKHKLKTKRRLEFEKIREVCRMLNKKEHLTEEGLTAIRKIVERFRSLSGLTKEAQ